jgi:hypothetical protein
MPCAENTGGGPGFGQVDRTPWTPGWGLPIPQRPLRVSWMATLGGVSRGCVGTRAWQQKRGWASRHTGRRFAVLITVGGDQPWAVVTE